MYFEEEEEEEERIEDRGRKAVIEKKKGRMERKEGMEDCLDICIYLLG